MTGMIIKRIPLHIWVAVSAWASRIITGLVQLVMVRILMVSLGGDRYAVFVLLTSIIGWYSMTDLGLGMSLQNFISERRAQGRAYADLLKTAGLITFLEWSIGSAILYGISLLAAPLFLHQFSFLSSSEMIKLFFISGFNLFTAGLASLVFKIWYAEQKGYLANIVPAVSSLLSLGIVWVVAQDIFQDKLLAALIGFTLPAAILGSVLLVSKLKPFFSKEKKTERFIVQLLFKRAMRFFGFSALGLIITQVDYFILSQTVKAYDIVVYNITTKLFSFAYTIYAAVLAAWHPVNCEMYVKSEFENIKKTARNYIACGLGGMGLFTLGIAVAMPWLTTVFSPKERITVPPLFIALLGGYFAVRIWNDTFVTLLVSMSRFRPVFKLAPFQVILSVFLQIILAQRFGIYGIIIGLIVAYLLTSVWYLPKTIGLMLKDVKE